MNKRGWGLVKSEYEPEKLDLQFLYEILFINSLIMRVKIQVYTRP